MEVRFLPPEPLRLPRATSSGSMSPPDLPGPSVAEPTTTSKRTLALVVLAAGKGKRLRSARPKVLHPICGRPALWHVLQAAKGARPTTIVIVVAHGADDVRDAVAPWKLTPKPVFVEQADQLGTGHAVQIAEQAIGRTDDVVVLGGDYDPITAEDVRALVRTHRRTRSAASVLTTELARPSGYGHVIREGDRLVRIVEHADATPGERRIHEVSLLAFAFRREDLFNAVPLIGRENKNAEYYLNEVFPILIDKGERVSAVKVDTGGAMGLNSRSGLAAVTRVVRDRINARHMANGVTIVDPATTYVDVGVTIGPDTVLHPNIYLEGGTRIGRGCAIGPSTRIVDGVVGDASEVTFSVVERSKIGREVHVGPFARLRAGAVLADGSQVGNFVEVKASRLGRGAKAKHLTYLGDADVGRGANVGAGTVTVNYDGYEKHPTVIGEDASVGSDTMLVAPVRVGKGAVTGAGSVITKDVPAGALAVERSDQRIIPGYRKRKDAERRAEGKGG
jgi:bifunctional UDP-N-acetylglucosamine pyrophosphorylase/glucosamine-1-phosphate N-acetyltransferase